MSEKEKLIQLVQQCNDADLIEYAIDLFENPDELGESVDWESLSEEDKKAILQSEEQIRNGRGHSHQEVIKMIQKKIDEWKK